MRCTTTWILLAAVVGLAGCQPTADNGASKLSSSTPSRSVAPMESLDIDTSRIVPIDKPINLAMQPMQSVAYTAVQSNPGQNGVVFILKGRVSFERTGDGLITRHRTLDSARAQLRSKSVDIIMSGEEIASFKPSGKVWSIAPVAMSVATTPPGNLSVDQWDKIRAEILGIGKEGTNDNALSCAIENFTYAQGKIQTGTPIAPTNRREFFDQLADCMMAESRGNSSPTDPDNIAFRRELMAAKEEQLPAIHNRVRDAYEQRWAQGVADFDGDVTVKGMVVENGQEFAYAAGTLTFTGGDGTRAAMKMQALIDPYSGLVYRQLKKAEVSSSPTPSDKRVEDLNGLLASFSIDLPSRTPTNVTIAEPRKPVTSPSGTGSVVDIYNRSIDAVYEVETPGGTGTGFAISGQQAITAAHVVEGSNQVTLISTSGDRLTAKVVKRDTQRDVALLELAGAQFPSALNLSRDFAITGAQVIVIGCPLGACGSVTTGIVSFSARRLRGVAMVQIDAQVNPGNSGGPILNTNGDVIGIVEEQINPDPAFQGLSFGLASPEIAKFLGI